MRRRSLFLLLAVVSLAACGGRSSQSQPQAVKEVTTDSSMSLNASVSKQTDETIAPSLSSTTPTTSSTPSSRAEATRPATEVQVADLTQDSDDRGPYLPEGALAEAGRHTFAQLAPIMDQPHLGRAPLGHFQAGEVVDYYAKLDQDGQTWLLYEEAEGVARYVPLDWPSETVAEEGLSQERATNDPYGGTYTLTETTAVYASPFLDQTPVAFYEAGEILTYQGQLELGGQAWLYLVQADGTATYVPISSAVEVAGQE